MKKVRELSPYEVAKNELFAASAALRQAESNFNYADPSFFEIANEELTMAKKRYSVAVQKVKQMQDQLSWLERVPYKHEVMGSTPLSCTTGVREN